MNAFCTLSRGRKPARISTEAFASAHAELARLRGSFDLWSVYPSPSELAALLILKGWTQGQFAQWFGRSRRSVIRWFRYGHRFEGGQKVRLLELVESLPPAEVSHLPPAPARNSQPPARPCDADAWRKVAP